jgi:hypothetical protein
MMLGMLGPLAWQVWEIKLILPGCFSGVQWVCRDISAPFIGF